MQALLLEHGDVARKISAMKQQLEDMGAVAARPASSSSTVARNSACADVHTAAQ